MCTEFKKIFFPRLRQTTHSVMKGGELLQRYVALKIAIDAHERKRIRETREDRNVLTRARAQLCNAFAGDVVYDGTKYWRVRETTTARVVTDDHIRSAIENIAQLALVLTPDLLARQIHALRLRRYPTLRASDGPPRRSGDRSRPPSQYEHHLLAQMRARKQLLHAHAEKHAEAQLPRAQELRDVERAMLLRIPAKLQAGGAPPRAIVQSGGVRFFVRVVERVDAARRRPVTLADLQRTCARVIAASDIATTNELKERTGAIADAVMKELCRETTQFSGGGRRRTLTLARAPREDPSAGAGVATPR